MLIYVYILRSLVDGTLYTGQTNDLAGRLRRHNRGAIQSTKAKAPYELVYFEVYSSRAGAMYREWELKTKWNTDRKKKLIAEFDKSRLTQVPGL